MIVTASVNRRVIVRFGVYSGKNNGFLFRQVSDNSRYSDLSNSYDAHRLEEILVFDTNNRKVLPCKIKFAILMTKVLFDKMKINSISFFARPN